MPKESGYANRDHGILGSTSRAFFFPSRGFPSRRHHFARWGTGPDGDRYWSQGANLYDDELMANKR